MNNIQVVICIDGLPLTKSNNYQLWPILAYIIDTNSAMKEVFFGMLVLR